MQRRLSQSGAHSENTTISKSEYILAKHIPTHNPLPLVEPERLSLLSLPSNKPVERDSSLHPSAEFPEKQSLIIAHETLKAEFAKLRRLLDEKAREHGNLVDEHANLVQIHEQLRKFYNNLIQENDQLINENQMLRSDLSGIKHEALHVSDLLHKAEGDLKNERANRIKAESENELLKKKVADRGDTPASNEIEQLTQERLYFEVQYKTLLEELQEMAAKKADSEAELGLKIERLQNQLDTLRKENQGKLLVQDLVNARLQDEKGLLDNEVINLNKAREDLENQIQRLQKQIDKANNKEIRSEGDNLELQNELEPVKSLLLTKSKEITKLEAELRALSTQQREKINDLTRSCQQLSEECEIRTVLLSIELERVHTLLADKLNEIDKLMVIIENFENERSGQVSQPKSPSSTAEVTVNLLKQAQARARELEDELDALSRDHKTTLEENDALKAQLSTLQLAHQLELKDLKEVPGEDLKAEFDKRVDALATKFAADKADADKRLREFQSKGFGAEIRCILFMTEIERLHSVIDEFVKDAELWQHRYLAMEEEHIKQMEVLKEQVEGAQGTDSNSELLKKKLAEYRTRIDELEKHTIQLQDQNKTLRLELDQTLLEAEKWKDEYDGLEKKRNSEIGTLKTEIEYNKNIAVQLLKDDPDSPRRAERNYVNMLIETQNNRVMELEKELTNLKNQLRESTKREHRNLAEADSWKNKYRLLESRAAIEGVPIPTEGLSKAKDPRLVEITEEDVVNASQKPISEQAAIYKAGYEEQLGLNLHLFKENQDLKRDNLEKGLESDMWRDKYQQQQQKHVFEIERLKNEFDLALQQELRDRKRKDEETIPKITLQVFERPETPSQQGAEAERGERLFGKPEDLLRQQQQAQSSAPKEISLKKRTPRSSEQKAVESGEISFKTPSRTGKDVGAPESERMSGMRSRFDPSEELVYLRPTHKEDGNLVRGPKGEEREVSPGLGDMPRENTDPDRGKFIPPTRESPVRSRDLFQKFSDVKADLLGRKEPKRVTTPKEPLDKTRPSLTGTSQQIEPKSVTPTSEYDSQRVQEEESILGGVSGVEREIRASSDTRKAGIISTEALKPIHKPETKKARGSVFETQPIIEEEEKFTQERPDTSSEHLKVFPRERPTAHFLATAAEEQTAGNQERSMAPDRTRDHAATQTSPSMAGRAGQPRVDDPFSREGSANHERFELSHEDAVNLDIKVMMLMIEIERLGNNLSSADQQNEQNQSTIRSLTTDKTTLEQHVEAQKAQLKDLTDRLNKIQEHLDNLEKENGQYATKERDLRWELERLRAKYESSPKEPAEKEEEQKKEADDLKEKISTHQLQQEELEAKLVDTLGQLERLHQLLNEREKEMQGLAIGRDELNQNIKNLQRQLEELEEQKQKELAEQQSQIETEKDKILQDQIEKITEENKAEIHRLEDEIEHLKGQIAALDTEKTQLQADLEKQIKETSTDFEKFANEKSQLQKELDDLKAKAEEENRLHNQQIDELKEEKERVKQESEFVKTNCEELTIRLVMIMAEFDRQFEISQQKEAQIADLENRARALQQQHEDDVASMTTKPNESLDVSMQKQKDDQEDEKEKMKAEVVKTVEVEKAALETALKAEIDKLLENLAASHQAEKAQLDSTIEDLKKRITELEEQVQQQTIYIENIKAENEHLHSENEKLTGSIEEKQKEINEMNMTIATLTTQVSTLETEKAQLEEERDKGQAAIQDLTSKNNELETNVAELQQEIERLNTLIKDLQEKLKNQEAKDAEFDELVDIYEALKKHVLEVQEVSVRFEAERTAHEAKVLRLENRIKELEIQNKSSTEELGNIKELLSQHNIQVDETQKQLMGKITDLDKLRSRYEECVAGLTTPEKRSQSRSKSPGMGKTAA